MHFWNCNLEKRGHKVNSLLLAISYSLSLLAFLIGIIIVSFLYYSLLSAIVLSSHFFTSIIPSFITLPSNFHMLLFFFLFSFLINNQCVAAFHISLSLLLPNHSITPPSPCFSFTISFLAVFLLDSSFSLLSHLLFTLMSYIILMNGITKKFFSLVKTITASLMLVP